MQVTELAECPPGPGLAAALASIQPAEVCGEQLVVVLRAEYRQRCHQEARHLALLVETARAQPGWVRSAQVNEWAASEIAAALRLTSSSAVRELNFALVVVCDLPWVHAAMYDGAVDRAKAWVFADVLAGLTEPQRAAICAQTVEPAADWTTGQLRARLQRLAIEIDPDWAARRHQQALRDRRVVAYLAEDGTVTLTGSGLPTCEAAAADRRLSRLADRIRRAGHPSPKARLKADLYLGLLDGSLQPYTDQQIFELFLAGSTAAGEGTRTGIELRVGLTMLLGLDERPGETPGLGPVLAADARTQVARQQRGGEWRFAVTDTEGRLIYGGLTRRRPTSPGGTSRGGIIELHISADRLATLAADPATCGQWAGVIADIAAQFGPRTQSLARLNRQRDRRYAPTGLNRHLQLRDRYCVGVGCRRAAADCDIDHTHDHAAGGDTTDSNTGPVCSQHHGYKTRGWWKLRQPRPGQFIWTSPLRQTYRTQGEPIDPPTIAPRPRTDPDSPPPPRPPPDDPER